MENRPECAAQQQKNVSARTRNCGERSACATDMPPPESMAPSASGWSELAISGGRLTSSAAGINSAQAMIPTVIMAVRQS